MVLGSDREGRHSHHRREIRPIVTPFLTRHGGKWCCGKWSPSVDFLAENLAANLQVSNEPLQLGFLVSVCPLPVSRHNYSGRPSQNGHGLQFSFPNNSAGNRGEGGREKKPQTSENDENTSKPRFKNEKIKIAKSQYIALYSFNPVPYSGQAGERGHFRDVRRVHCAFRASRVS